MPILLSKSLNREKFIYKLESLGVETRPIISGNFLKQPAIKKYNLIRNNKFINSDIINDHGFFIGLPTKKISNKFINRLVKIFEKNI